MPQKIVAAIDLAHEGVGVLPVAFDLSRHFKAELFLVTVLPQVPPLVEAFLPSGFHEQAAEDAKAGLREMLEELGMSEADCQFVVRTGVAYDEVIDYASESGADLIVVGSHAPNAADYLLGSTAAKIVRHAPCSVYVVRSNNGE